MKRIQIVWFAIIILMSTTVMAASGWKLVKVWTGDGISQTEIFSVGREWRIDWVSKSSDGYLGVYIYSADGTLVGVAANKVGAGQGQYFMHRSGKYYLQANGMGAWKLTVVKK